MVDLPDNPSLPSFEPSIESSPFGIERLNARIDNGTFLLLRNVSAPTLRVGRLLRWRSFTNRESTIVVHLYCVNNPLGSGPSHNTRHMKRVSRTDEVKEISSADVLDICFVFPESELNTHVYVGQGRKDTFSLNTDDTTNFIAFPCQSASFKCGVSYAFTIWDDMDRVRLVLRTVLCSERNDQSVSSRRTERANISLSCWQYMVRQVGWEASVQYLPDYLEKSKIEYMVSSGAAYVSKRRKYGKCSKLIFNTEASLKCIVQLFGESSIVGIRRRRPRLEDPERRPILGNALSYLTGMTLTFFDSTISIRVVYQRYAYRANALGIPINCPTLHLRRFLCFLDTGSDDPFPEEQQYCFNNNGNNSNNSNNNNNNYGNDNNESDDDSDDDDDNDKQEQAENLLLVRPGITFMLNNHLHKVVCATGNNDNDLVEVILASSNNGAEHSFHLERVDVIRRIRERCF